MPYKDSDFDDYNEDSTKAQVMTTIRVAILKPSWLADLPGLASVVVATVELEGVCGVVVVVVVFVVASFEDVNEVVVVVGA